MKNIKTFFTIIAIVLGVCIWAFSCNYVKNKNAENKVAKFIENSNLIIDNLKSKTEEHKLTDSIRCLEIQAIEVAHTKTVEHLQDSLMDLAASVVKLKHTIAILKAKGIYKAPEVQAFYIDTTQDKMTDELCEYLKSNQENFIKIPKGFTYKSDWLTLFGTVNKNGIYFPADSIQIKLRPSVLFGEKQKWFLAKKYHTAILYDENPFINYNNATFISTKPIKTNHIGGYVGYGASYNPFNKTFGHGIQIGFGFLF